MKRTCVVIPQYYVGAADVEEGTSEAHKRAEREGESLVVVVYNTAYVERIPNDIARFGAIGRMEVEFDRIVIAADTSVEQLYDESGKII